MKVRAGEANICAVATDVSKLDSPDKLNPRIHRYSQKFSPSMSPP